MSTHVVIETSMGQIELELWPDRAPRHVANFEKLVAMKFYDNLLFHRVIPGFMIQTGCPNGTGTGGPGWKVDQEFNKTPFTRGVVGMARSAHPNSAGSQFFICVADAGHLNGSYSAFGKVVVGMEVCDKIANAPRDNRDHPLEDIRMLTATMPDLKKKLKPSQVAKTEPAPAPTSAPVAAVDGTASSEKAAPVKKKRAAKAPVTSKATPKNSAASKAKSKKPASGKAASKKSAAAKTAAKKHAAGKKKTARSK